MKATLRKTTAAWPLVIFLLLPALTRAETAVQAWVQRYNGPGNDFDELKAVAVDSNNDLIVTGTSYSSGNFADYATIKYSSAGVPLWTNRYHYSYGTTGRDNGYATAVAVDGSNNVIVTGYSASFVNYYTTIKYSSAGVPLWTNRYYVGRSEASAVAVDGSNNVIVTGWSYGSGSSYDYATIKYSSAGTPIWTNRYNGPGNGDDQSTGLAVDGNNDVIVTGYSTNNTSGYDYATIKYSSAGVPLWTNRYNGPGNGDDEASAVAVDSTNNVIVTGYSYGTEGYRDYAMIKYSSDGVPLWTNRYNGPGNGTDQANAVVVDRSNNVIVTGQSSGVGYGDSAMIKYSSAGAPLWTNRYDSSLAYAAAVDGSNNVIVTGSSDFSGYNEDYATIKYSSAGVPLWTNRYNGPGNGYDIATAVAVDHSGNVIVAGDSWNGTNYDFATIKYICVPSPVVTGLSSTNGTFQLRVDDVLQPGTLVIEAGTNLSTTNWAPVFTNTTPTNVLFYTDPDASNAPTRFYRAFQFP